MRLPPWKRWGSDAQQRPFHSRGRGALRQDLAAETLYLFHFDQVYESRLAEFVREAASTFHGAILLPEALKWYTIT